MAKKWTNRNLAGALHFITGNTLDRRPIFKNEKYCIAFLEELQELRANRDWKLIAFVIMLDHIHLILNPKGGDIQTATGFLKGLSAKRIVKLAPSGYFLNGDENQVWQESFKSLALWSGWMITQKVNYIHSNPVRAGLCDSANDYRWSSFRSFYSKDTDPVFSVDQDWWWPGDLERLAVTLGKEELEKIERLKEARKRI
jgi:REP element-mobilizing transposase RayT